MTEAINFLLAGAATTCATAVESLFFGRIFLHFHCKKVKSKWHFAIHFFSRILKGTLHD